MSDRTDRPDNKATPESQNAAFTSHFDMKSKAPEKTTPAQLSIAGMKGPKDADKAYWTERRFTDNGVASIGDEVIYDGEAVALGVRIVSA
jgi:hypothetical protein